MNSKTWIYTTPILLALTLFLSLPQFSWAYQAGTISIPNAAIKSSPAASATTVGVAPFGTRVNLSDNPSQGYYRVSTRTASGWVAVGSVLPAGSTVAAKGGKGATQSLKRGIASNGSPSKLTGFLASLGQPNWIGGDRYTYRTKYLTQKTNQANHTLWFEANTAIALGSSDWRLLPTVGFLIAPARWTFSVGALASHSLAQSLEAAVGLNYQYWPKMATPPSRLFLETRLTYLLHRPLFGDLLRGFVLDFSLSPGRIRIWEFGVGFQFRI